MSLNCAVRQGLYWTECRLGSFFVKRHDMRSNGRDWAVSAFGYVFVLFLIGAAGLCAEVPEDPDPALAHYFSSGQYHRIFAPAASRLEASGSQAALAYYRVGYVFELGLGRLPTA